MGARESKPEQVADYYELLQVDENATAEEIKVSAFRWETISARHLQPAQKSFRRLALIHHPDKNTDDVEGATQRFSLIQQAYEVWRVLIDFISPLRSLFRSRCSAMSKSVPSSDLIFDQL